MKKKVGFFLSSSSSFAFSILLCCHIAEVRVNYMVVVTLVNGMNLSFSQMYWLYLHSLASDTPIRFVIHSWMSVQLLEQKKPVTIKFQH